MCALQEQITTEFEQIRELLRHKEEALRLEAIKLAEKACHGHDKIAKAQELKMKITDLEESITTDGVSFLQVFIFLHNVPVKKNQNKTKNQTKKHRKTTKQQNKKMILKILFQFCYRIWQSSKKGNRI